MGQFGNQPDFGTSAKAITKTDTITPATNINASCLYVGTAGDVNVMPVIVDYVVATNTTASDIIAIK